MIRALPENEIPPAMRVDFYLLNLIVKLLDWSGGKSNSKVIKICGRDDTSQIFGCGATPPRRYITTILLSSKSFFISLGKWSSVMSTSISSILAKV